MDMVAVVVGGMLVCLLLLFMFARVCCQRDIPNHEEEERRKRWRSREPAISTTQDLPTLSTYVPWVPPTRLFPKLFQASVHPYLLPSMPFHSAVAMSSARSDAECSRPAPISTESGGASRKPMSSVAGKCRLRASVPLADRLLSTRPAVPPLPRPARKFPPTGATLTESAVRRIAQLPMTPVHRLPRVHIPGTRSALQLPTQAELTVRQARTRAWVLSQIEMQAEVEMVPAVAPSALGCETCCRERLQLLKEWTNECGHLQPQHPQQETAVQPQEEEEAEKDAAEEQSTAM